MKTVAKRGEIEMRVKPGTDVNAKGAKCVLYNPISKKTSKEMLVQVALKWGYWVPVSAKKAKLVVKGAKA